MDELTTTFAEARFGKELAKEALSPQLTAQMQALAGMPELSDNKRKLRDLIEKSIRGEQSRIAEAKELISYGKKRLTDPDRMGGTGTLALDAIRSLIPGLSISASADGGIEKEAKDPDERAPGRAFDIAHALAAAGGAGTGYAAQKGLFGGAYGRDVAERMVGGAGALRKALLDDILGEIPKGGPDALRRAFESAARTHDVGLAAQSHTPLLNRITRLFSGKTWRKGGQQTARQARYSFMRAVRQHLRSAGVRPGVGEVRALMRQLPNSLSNVLGAARGSTERAGFMPGGWKGALIGTTLATLPFVISRFLKTRKLRQRGGTAAESSAEKAEKLLSEAGALREGRQRLFAN